VTWQPGRDKIAELLAAAELQQVTADHRIAQLLLDDAGRHVATAAAALSSGDLSGAYQLAYDALRKSAASLLTAQRLRATSRGGHIAIQEVAQAQFGSTVKAFKSGRRARVPAAPCRRSDRRFAGHDPARCPVVALLAREWVRPVK
jgi:hypothetical protein